MGKSEGKRKGMPIGSVLSGSLAVLYSVVWSRRFKSKLNFAVSELANFSELLRKVYIDDNTVVTTPTPPSHNRSHPSACAPIQNFLW